MRNWIGKLLDSKMRSSSGGKTNEEELRLASSDIASLRSTIDNYKIEIGHAEHVIRRLIKRHYRNMPLPPEALRLNVGTRTSAANFWAQGINSSTRVIEIFSETPTEPILDWGCGSGRTLLWLNFYTAYQRYYHGCDVDSAAIDWLKENGQINAKVCNDDPPLPYADQTFGGVFAFSVLTHIHPAKHRLWYSEIRRVLQPGGLAYLTVFGPSKLGAIPAAARDNFDRDGYAYLEQLGHYKSAAIVSPDYTLGMLQNLFSILDYKESGYQDMDAFLIRRLN